MAYRGRGTAPPVYAPAPGWGARPVYAGYPTPGYGGKGAQPYAVHSRYTPYPTVPVGRGAYHAPAAPTPVYTPPGYATQPRPIGQSVVPGISRPLQPPIIAKDQPVVPQASVPIVSIPTPSTPLIPSVGIPQQDWDLPFNVALRGVADHQSRNLRRSVPDDLLRVHCHWVHFPPDDCNFLSHTTRVVHSEDNIPAPPSQAPEGATTDIRALIIPGPTPNASLHILSRLAVVAGKVFDGQDKTHLEAYGGLVDPGLTTEVELKAALSRMVREQAGCDIQEWRRFVEFEYKGGHRTVYFVAEGLPEEIRVATQEHPKGDEACGHSLAVQPVRVPFSSLLDMQVEKAEHEAMLSLLMAVDALDEFVKRGMLLRIASFLKHNAVHRRTADKEARARRNRIAVRNQKRLVEDEARKEERKQKELELQEQWREEDEGKTDEAKQETMRERVVMLQEVWKREDEELARRREEEERIEEEEGGAGKTRRVLIEPDLETFVAFQYLDRPRTPLSSGTGQIQRARLASLLQCLELPELSTQASVRLLLERGLPPGAAVWYKQICHKITPEEGMLDLNGDVSMYGEEEEVVDELVEEVHETKEEEDEVDPEEAAEAAAEAAAELEAQAEAEAAAAEVDVVPENEGDGEGIDNEDLVHGEEEMPQQDLPDHLEGMQEGVEDTENNGGEEHMELDGSAVPEDEGQEPSTPCDQTGDTQYTADEVGAMSYKELQAACKQAGLKATGKTEELRTRLLSRGD